MLLQLLDGGERGAVQGLALRDREPCFDLIEPRRPRWGEMETDFGVFLEPALVLLMRVEIVDNDVKLAIREGGNDAVHEAEELDTAAPLGMRRDDPSGGDFERGKQGRGAMPLVVVALPGQGAAVRQLQIALRPLQGLDRRLFVLVQLQSGQSGGLSVSPCEPGRVHSTGTLPSLAAGAA